MVVAPGFIDMLGQSEITILVNPHLPSKIFQGITTEITGEGGSAAPLNDAIIKADQPPTSTTEDHAGLEHTAASISRGWKSRAWASIWRTYVGATQVRRMVLGDDNRSPTPAQLERMKALVREAMHDGAVGVSTSLQYAPAPYASTEELIALAARSRQIRRHLRHAHAQRRRSAITAAIDEAVRIGREAHIPVEIWHLKAAGKPQLGPHAADRRPN